MTNKESYDNKKIYLTQGEYIEAIFCANEGCSECYGTYMNGEPNGYGCQAAEEFFENTETYEEIDMGDNIQYVKFDDIEPYVKELEKIKEEYLEFVKGIEKREGPYNSPPSEFSSYEGLLWNKCKEIIKRLVT